jgi:hypothetical protein
MARDNNRFTNYAAQGDQVGLQADNVAALRQQYVNGTRREPWGEAAAAAVLLGFEPVSADRRFAAHVDRDGVDWDAVLADKTWTATERFLIATAAGAWNGRRTLIDISRVAWLDDTFLQAWLGIIRARIDGRVQDGTSDETGELFDIEPYRRNPR